MITAEDIYTKDNHLVISKDTILTDKIITRLEFYSIIELSVYATPPQMEEIEEDTTYFERIFTIFTASY